MRTIKGLNIFSLNDVRTTPPSDPRVEFLRLLSQQHICAAFIGMVNGDYFTGDDWIRFQNALSVGEYAGVNVYQGSFFATENGEREATLYIPRVSDNLWTFSLYPGELTVASIMRYGAVALGARSDHEVHSTELPAFTDEDSWLEALTGLFKLVIMTGHDGDYLCSYTRDPANHALIEEPLDAVARMITSSQWYQAHALELVWNEGSECWELPR